MAAHPSFHKCAQASAAVVLLLGVVQAVGAQEAKDPWAAGLARVELGELVIFEVDGSPRQTGLLQSVSPESLTVMVTGQPTQIRREQVNRLWKKGDSKLNGFLIGAGSTAVLLGAVMATVCGNDCEADAFAVGLVALYSGLGGLAGMGVDAMIEGKTLLYRRPTGMAFSPIVAPDRVGVQARLHW
jgi:hypothetical protein